MFPYQLTILIPWLVLISMPFAANSPMASTFRSKCKTRHATISDNQAKNLQTPYIPYRLYMLWFKFILGLMCFELVPILFAIVLDYGNEYMTKETNNWTSFKNFAPKLNLNHNIYTLYCFLEAFISIKYFYLHDLAAILEQNHEFALL